MVAKEIFLPLEGLKVTKDSECALCDISPSSWRAAVGPRDHELSLSGSPHPVAGREYTFLTNRNG